MMGDHGPSRPFFVVQRAAIYTVIPAVAGRDRVNGDLVCVPSKVSVVGSTMAVSEAFAYTNVPITPYGFDFTLGEAVESRYRTMIPAVEAD